MTNISVSDVQKLARLSAIQLTPNEVEQLAGELPKILDYVEQLNDVNTENVTPTYQVNNPQTVTRTDEIIDYGVLQGDLLKNAAAVQDGQVKVPRVLE